MDAGGDAMVPNNTNKIFGFGNLKKKKKKLVAMYIVLYTLREVGFI